MAATGAAPDAELAAAALDGFGPDAAGEDRFDSVLGVLCVIGVLDGRRPDFVPDDPWLARWEGWVLGQTAPPLARPPDRHREPPLGGVAIQGPRRTSGFPGSPRRKRASR